MESRGEEALKPCRWKGSVDSYTEWCHSKEGCVRKSVITKEVALYIVLKDNAGIAPYPVLFFMQLPKLLEMNIMENNNIFYFITIFKQDRNLLRL